MIPNMKPYILWDRIIHMFKVEFYCENYTLKGIHHKCLKIFLYGDHSPKIFKTVSTNDLHIIFFLQDFLFTYNICTSLDIN
jgi:hypothetical protein